MTFYVKYVYTIVFIAISHMQEFQQRDALFGLESKLSRDILEKSIKKFRVSKDFCVAKDMILKPNKLNAVTVRLEKSLFPDTQYISP